MTIGGDDLPFSERCRRRDEAWADWAVDYDGGPSPELRDALALADGKP